MKTHVYLLLLAGLALFTALIGYHGFADVVNGLVVCGWGLVWITFFHVLPLAADAVAWHKLWIVDKRPSLRLILWGRWIGESVDGLLPVAQVGGALVKARLISQHGFSAAVSGATVVLELTLSVFTLIIFSLVGVVEFLDPGNNEVVVQILLGLGILAAFLAGFFLVQRRGLFGKIAGTLMGLTGEHKWHAVVGEGVALDAAILDIYRNRRALISSSIWLLFGWILGIGEVWLAMYFLGAPLNLTEALVLESLGQAVRSAAFMVPGALGVLEGGFLVLGNFLGIPPDLALALSLIKRVRIFLLGVPGLILWQMVEGRRILRRHPRGNPAPDVKRGHQELSLAA